MTSTPLISITLNFFKYKNRIFIPIAKTIDNTIPLIDLKEYFDEDRLNILLSQLERTPKRYDLVMQYLNISGYGAAVTLKNPNIIKEVSRVILLKKTGISAAVLSALCSKGIMEIYKYEVNRIKPRNMSLINQLPLSDAQQKAYNDINSKFQEKNIWYLHCFQKNY